VLGAPLSAVVAVCRLDGLYTGMNQSTTTPAHPNAETRQSTRTLLVDVLQAAEMLSLSRSSIYQLIWNGQLTPVRIGRSVRFSVEHLEQFVADGITEGGQCAAEVPELSQPRSRVLCAGVPRRRRSARW